MTLYPELKDPRYWCCMVIATVLVLLHPITAGLVAGAGGTAFYLHFIKRANS